VSTKGSCVEIAANPLGEEHATDVVPTTGLYFQCHHSTRMVALGKVYDGAPPYTMWLMQMMGSR